MKTYHLLKYIVLLSILLTHTLAYGVPWEEYQITNTPNLDERGPDVSGNIIVWYTYRGSQSDIIAANITDINEPEIFVISGTEASEKNPCISEYYVVWERRQTEQSHSKIWAMDIDSNEIFRVLDSNFSGENPDVDGNSITWVQYGEEDEVQIMAAYCSGSQVTQIGLITSIMDDTLFPPSISDHLVVWSTYKSGDIQGADICDLSNILYFPVGTCGHQKKMPVISEQWVVWTDLYENTSQALADNIFDPYLPIIVHPDINLVEIDIAKNIVVWSERHGNDFDIYAYNLATKEEFLVCDQPGNQVKPAICSGSKAGEYIVVWEDDRNSPDNTYKRDIYATILSGPTVSGCVSPPRWDVNADCVVNFRDFALLADHWLEAMDSVTTR